MLYLIYILILICYRVLMKHAYVKGGQTGYRSFFGIWIWTLEKKTAKQASEVTFFSKLEKVTAVSASPAAQAGQSIVTSNALESWFQELSNALTITQN